LAPPLPEVRPLSQFCLPRVVIHRKPCQNPRTTYTYPEWILHMSNGQPAARVGDILI
jgi:hypothetical protein